ncbi:hypothetical protein TIFTF001_037681 [Ficus carica]|uniref:Secreted protein n=1 Tax=Ficus carica TaxID=3494 RepID=A0AA88J990_FICCA|nr:hypothetical protein TIFTF001_015475 [Ficus carica]GMN68628.1 hypothetical protein TIFTF001_037681 [Ficus carica]
MGLLFISAFPALLSPRSSALVASHSPPNRELAGLASQPLSNRDKKLGVGHGATMSRRSWGGRRGARVALDLARKRNSGGVRKERAPECE